MNPQDPDETLVEVYYYFLNRYKEFIDEHYLRDDTPPFYIDFFDRVSMTLEMCQRFRHIYSIYWIEKDCRERAMQHAIEWDLERHGVETIDDLWPYFEAKKMQREDINRGSDLGKRKRVNSE